MNLPMICLFTLIKLCAIGILSQNIKVITFVVFYIHSLSEQFIVIPYVICYGLLIVWLIAFSYQFIL